MKNLILAMATAAALVWSIRVVTAANTTVQGAPSEVCYDDLGNTRYVTPGEACKPGEKRTKVLPQMAPDPADDPMAQLQKQVTDLVAKVSALQAQLEQSKKDQSDSDKEAPEYASTKYIDAKTQKQIESMVQRLVTEDEARVNDPDSQFQKMPGQKSPGTKDQGTLPGSAVSHRITAPFEVVDNHGKVILRVGNDAETSNGAGVTIGDIEGSQNYGVRVFNRGGKMASYLGTFPTTGGGFIAAYYGGQMTASMDASLRSVSVFNGPSASASVIAHDKGGEVTVYNAGTPVAHMSVTGVHGGEVSVARSDGFGIFTAEANPEGGGDVCVNRVKNKWCMGTNLPLQIN